MKAALYVRVSTTEQSKKFSLDAQERELRKYVAEHAFEVHKVYRDHCSGMHWERQEELASLVADAEQKQFDVVLVTERDRLTRDPDGASILKYIFA